MVQLSHPFMVTGTLLLHPKFCLWDLIHHWVHKHQIFSITISMRPLYGQIKFVSFSPFAFSSVQLSSVTQSCLTLCDPMNHSTLGLPVYHQFLESTQTHVHWVSDAIQPSHPLLSPSPPALNLSQNKGLFKCISSSHQVAKVLEFQLKHQSFQWTPRTDLL